MKLSQTYIDDYFSINPVEAFWLSNTETYKLFHFEDRNSQNLLVTIGDSWTWGSDIAVDVRDPARQNQERLDKVYGSVLSRHLDSDWLNLAMPASGNACIALQSEQLSDIIPDLEYDKIYVICTFTDAGRSFDTIYCRHIDYVTWFRDDMENFDQLLETLNRMCVQRIFGALSKFSHVKVLFGNNFIDPLGFEQIPDQCLLPLPWYKVLGGDDGKNIYVIYDGIEQLLLAPQFLPAEKIDDFKQWIVGLIDLSVSREKILLDENIYRNWHPYAKGHNTWANYILDYL